MSVDDIKTVKVWNGSGIAIIDIALVVSASQLEHLKKHSERLNVTITHIASQALREWIAHEDAAASDDAQP